MINPRSKPVTYDDVARVLRALETEGQAPSVRLVHARVGSGSLSTISKYMQRYHCAAASRSHAHTDFKESLPGLYQQLQDVAAALVSEAIAQERIQHTSMREELEAKAKKAQHEHALALILLREQAESNALLKAEVVHTQCSLHNMAEHNSTLNTELTAWRKQCHAQAVELEQLRAKHADGVYSPALESQLLQARSNELRLTQEHHRLESRLTQAEHQLAAEQQRARSAEAKRDELQALVSELSMMQLTDKKQIQALQAQLETTQDKLTRLAEHVSQLQQNLLDTKANSDLQREADSQQHRSVIIGLVEHGKRLCAFAKQPNTPRGAVADLNELVISQREIERLFL